MHLRNKDPYNQYTLFIKTSKAVSLAFSLARTKWVSVIIAINIAVFLLWSFYDTRFMAENFLVSWAHLEDKRYWTLLTSVFSHNAIWHILINMFVLKGFGEVVEMTLGSRRFIQFYILAGIISSLSHALVSNFIMFEPNLPALGASGAISGVVLLFSLLYPKEKIAILGIIPVPAIFGAFAFMGLDIWGLTAQAGGGGLPIGHGAHLGGAFTGIAYYIYLRAKRRSYLR